MAKTPTPKPPAATPGQPDQVALLATLKALDAKAVANDSRSARIEMLIEQLVSRQADAEKQQDIRITEKLAPLSIRGITATERVIEILESLPVQIEQAGRQASQEMARNSLLAKRLMEGVETAAFIRMQTMRDQATAMVREVQEDAVTKMEKAKDEAVIVLQGMGNAAKTMVANSAVSIAEKLREAARLGKTLVENTGATAEAAIERTATKAATEYVKATAAAKQAFDLSTTCVITFEANMTRLERVGLWLDGALEHRTHQIARATGVRMALALCLAAVMYRGTVWALGTGF